VLHLALRLIQNRKTSIKANALTQDSRKCIEQIDDVSTKAIKEEGIEKEMKQMKDGWAHIEFELMPMKSAKEVDIIKNFELR